MFHAIQYTETFAERTAADACLAFLRTQSDYIGGRVLRQDLFGSVSYLVQAFFADSNAEWLPDGCRRVVVLPGQQRMLGIA